MFGSKKRKERRKAQKQNNSSSFPELEAIAGNYKGLYQVIVVLILISFVLLAFNPVYFDNNVGVMWTAIFLLIASFSTLAVMLYFQVRSRRVDIKTQLHLKKIEEENKLLKKEQDDEINAMVRLMTEKEKNEYGFLKNSETKKSDKKLD